jgi:GTP-binding protein
LDRVIATTRATIAKRPAAHPDLIVTSSETKAGLDILRAEIELLIRT